MPIYEFICCECGENFENLMRISDEKPPRCKYCGSENTKRIMSACARSAARSNASGATCGPSSSGFS
ncbi:MAG: FmdB family zinc ribbon protein [Desulfatibacillaceae bacterium]